MYREICIDGWVLCWLFDMHYDQKSTEIHHKLCIHILYIYYTYIIYIYIYYYYIHIYIYSRERDLESWMQHRPLESTDLARFCWPRWYHEALQRRGSRPGCDRLWAQWAGGILMHFDVKKSDLKRWVRWEWWLYEFCMNLNDVVTM